MPLGFVIAFFILGIVLVVVGILVAADIGGKLNLK